MLEKRKEGGGENGEGVKILECVGRIRLVPVSSTRRYCKDDARKKETKG